MPAVAGCVNSCLRTFFRLDSKKYDMISVNVEIRIKNMLRKEMEKSYESKRSEFEKGKDENSDGADGSRYTVGSQTVFPGKLPQYVSGNSDPVFVHGTCCIRSDTGSNDSGRIGDGDSDLYLFGRNTGRDQRILCKDSCVGYHFTYDKRFSYGGNWICTDRPV